MGIGGGGGGGGPAWWRSSGGGAISAGMGGGGGRGNSDSVELSRLSRTGGGEPVPLIPPAGRGGGRGVTGAGGGALTITDET